MKIFFDETQKERGKINTNYSILRDSLRSEGFEVENYNDFPISEKSLRCDVLVFACPDGSKLAKNEIDAILNFLERGGGLLVIGNAGGDRGLRTNMNEVLNRVGIEMLSDQVKDETNNEFNMPTHPIVNDIKDHPITQGVAEIVIVAGCSVRGSSSMAGIAHTSPVAEPPNAPVLIAGEYKGGRVVAIGSYRLFSNYGAGLSLRNNKTLAKNIFQWLARKDTSKAGATVTAKKPQKSIASVVPPKSKPVTSKTTPSTPPVPSTTADAKKSSIPPPPTKVATPKATSSTKVSDQSVVQEIEHLRADISAMRDIIARLYSDTLGYLQEMKEEVRIMSDYIRSKEE